MTTPPTGRDAALDGSPGPESATAAEETGRTSRRRLDPLLSAMAVTVALALAVAAVMALRDRSGGGGGVAFGAVASSAAPAVTPPVAQVRPVHKALHDIDSVCRTKGQRSEQMSLARDVDTVITFSRRYPDARFPIDGETGTTLSLLLVTRQGLRDCAPGLAARVNQALPLDFRGPVATPS
ncbi:hypothetical protein [Streptomyces sp. NPDC088350]|uniref:hypothetical protein n=1 Tax=Streptomyces sp. NPDC088350 TaxID=3365854 RepID=UPI0038082DD0